MSSLHHLLQRFYGSLKQEEAYPYPVQVKSVDLSGAFALLDEAIAVLAHYPQLQSQRRELDNANHLIAQLKNQLSGYEAEQLKLKAELEHAKSFAQSSWQSFKAADAELNQLRSAISDLLSEL